MTNEEFNKKWDSDLYEDMRNETNEQIRLQKMNGYVNDCFDMYETEGFCDTFESPYESLIKHNGKKFSVVRRCSTDDGFDIGALPAWKIKFEDGEEIEAMPEEICKIERQ